MTNKNLFKKVYQENINKDKNYEQIISKLKSPKRSRRIYFKIAYACLILIFMSSLLFISNQNHKYQNDSNPETIPTNKTETSYDGQEEIFDGADTLKKEFAVEKFFIKLSLPNDFMKTYRTSEVSSSEKDINNYESLFQNVDGTRTITISYSSENKPLNNNSFLNKYNLKINEKEITIYYKNDKYITEFTHKDMNYLIETKNITEKELIDLLESIIK